MGSLDNSQENCGPVPPSSSPAPSPGSECDIVGSTYASRPATSPPYALSPESSDAKVSDYKGNNDATGNPLRNANELNLALLSPFAISKGERVSENITTQFQHAIRSIPSSPSVPPSASDSISNTASLVSNVLQSPFGIHLKTTSSLSDNLFASSSPESPASLVERSHPDQRTEVVCHVGNEGRKDNNAPSDSGESVVGATVTPRIFKYAHRAIPSSPYLVGGFAEMEGSKETTICFNVDNINEVDPTSKPLYSTFGASESICVIPTTLGEPISTPDSKSSCTNDLWPRNGRSISKNPTEEPKAVSKDSNHCSPLKRARDPDDREPSFAPKRMTLASQQKQHRKLASPFRSPLLTKPSAGNIFTPDTRAPCVLQPSSAPPKLRVAGTENRSSTPNTELTGGLMQPRSPLSSSAKAKTPFKSPLVTSSPAGRISHISSSRTIQELERKVQLLRRAVKIKREDEEVKLEQLVQKWRAAGREAAWELWRIVRDEESTEAPYPGTNLKSFGGSSEGSWGWAGPRSSHSSSWGWDGPLDNGAREDDIRSEELESPTKVEREVFDALRKGPTVPRTTMLPPTPRGAYYEQVSTISSIDDFNANEEDGLNQGNGTQEEDHASTPAKTLGTMLHQLGISHETLGWVEQEGDFVDA